MKSLNHVRIYLGIILLTGACQVLATPQNGTVSVTTTTFANPTSPSSLQQAGSQLQGQLSTGNFSNPSIDDHFKNIKNDSVMGGTGVDGGGGNALSSDHPGIGEITQWVQQSKIPARFALKRLELSITTIKPGVQPLIDSLKKKLFDGKVTIYDAIDKAQLNSQENDACYDRYAAAVDGSAKDSPVLCISAQRLSKVLATEDAQQKILALVIHEVSHMLGTTEPEAQMLQYMAQSNFSKDPITNIPEIVSEYKKSLQEALTNMNDILGSIPFMAPGEICMSIGMAMDQISRLQNDMYTIGQDKGIDVFRPKELSILAGLTMKAANMTSFCYRPAFDKQLSDAFGNKDQISLADFEATVYAKEDAGVLRIQAPPWQIHRIRQGDKADLTIEVQDMKKILTNMLRNF